MKALFAKIETLFTRIAHKAEGLFQMGSLMLWMDNLYWKNVYNVCSKNKKKNNNFGTKT